MTPTWAEMAESDADKAEKALKEKNDKEIKLKKKHHKELRKDLVKNFKLTVKDILGIFDAIGVFAPVMDAASGIVEIFSGKLQVKLLPSMQGIIDAILGEEMMTALDLVATGFSTILDPIISALGVAIAAAPMGVALGASIGGLIGSFAGNAEIGALIGGALGFVIEQAPIGSIIGGGLGTLIGSFAGSPIIGGVIGTALGFLIEEIAKSFTRTEFGDMLDMVIEAGYTLQDLNDMLLAGLSYEEILTKIKDKVSDDTLARDPPTDAQRLMAIAAVNITGGGLQAFQSGTPYVPESGIYHLTRGEAVIPASENSGGTGDINITIKGNLVGQHAMRELIEEIEYKRSIGRL